MIWTGFLILSYVSLVRKGLSEGSLASYLMGNNVDTRCPSVVTRKGKDVFILYVCKDVFILYVCNGLIMRTCSDEFMISDGYIRTTSTSQINPPSLFIFSDLKHHLHSNK